MKNKTTLQLIIDKFFHFDNPNDFSQWFELNFDNLKEYEKKELIEAHSEGIKFMAENSSIPQPGSISWFRQKYDINYYFINSECNKTKNKKNVKTI